VIDKTPLDTPELEELPFSRMTTTWEKIMWITGKVLDAADNASSDFLFMITPSACEGPLFSNPNVNPLGSSPPCA